MIISAWALFMVILAAAVLVAYLGITTSSSVDLILVTAEMAVLAALAITVLVKLRPATGIFYLLVIRAEAFAAGRHGIAGFIGQPSPLGYLTSRYWSPSVLCTIDLAVVLTGLTFVVAALNAAIRILFTMGREKALPEPLARRSRTSPGSAACRSC